jgi:hypothetical protein
VPEQEHACAGGCGRSVLPHQSACLSCWDLIDPALREAIKARRGPLREALIGQAREWFADNVRDGKLINPPDQITPGGTLTLARPSEFVPAAAPAARSPRAPDHRGLAPWADRRDPRVGQRPSASRQRAGTVRLTHVPATGWHHLGGAVPSRHAQRRPDRQKGD